MKDPRQKSDFEASIARLPIPERLHLSIRYRSAPWEEIVPQLTGAASVLDLGCGPGVFGFLLAHSGFAGQYLGVDLDERKIRRARTWPGENENRHFRCATLEQIPGTFSRTALIDVLYLIPRVERPAFIARACETVEPGGVFLAVTSGGGPAWKRRFDRLQERAAVSLLGFTAGKVVEPCDGAEVARYLSEAGLIEAEVADIGTGYLHGFERVTARRV